MYDAAYVFAMRAARRADLSLALMKTTSSPAWESIETSSATLALVSPPPTRAAVARATAGSSSRRRCCGAADTPVPATGCCEPTSSPARAGYSRSRVTPTATPAMPSRSMPWRASPAQLPVALVGHRAGACSARAAVGAVLLRTALAPAQPAEAAALALWHDRLEQARASGLARGLRVVEDDRVVAEGQVERVLDRRGLGNRLVVVVVARSGLFDLLAELLRHGLGL